MPEAKQTYQHTQTFKLESGKILPGFHLAYTTYGQLNEEKSNTVWIFHALTANSEPFEWWHGLVGEGNIFDPEKYFIVCVNMPGSCYGSFGPLNTGALNPALPGTYDSFLYHDFPFFTTRDMVRAYIRNRLSRFSVPRDITFLEELPRTATGKVIKRMLIEPPTAAGM